MNIVMFVCIFPANTEVVKIGIIYACYICRLTAQGAAGPFPQSASGLVTHLWQDLNSVAVITLGPDEMILLTSADFSAMT